MWSFEEIQLSVNRTSLVKKLIFEHISAKEVKIKANNLLYSTEPETKESSKQLVGISKFEAIS